MVFALVSIIGLLAVPILICVFFNSGLTYLLNWAVHSPHCVAGFSVLIGASNFFELEVATAIALFGFELGGTVVGVLIEVPVMLVGLMSSTGCGGGKRHETVSCPMSSVAR